MLAHMMQAMKHASSFSERIVKRYYLDGDLNCAEALLYGANERYKLGLKQECLLVSAGFGGGMGIQSVCGALTGAIMALGVLFVENRSHEGEVMKQLAGEYLDIFASRHGSILCSDLKDTHFTEELRCAAVVAGAAELLEEFIEKNRELRIR